MKNNAYLTTDDPIIIHVYDADTTIEMFGGDTLEEYGCHVPEELLERYKANHRESKAIQSELRRIKKESDK